MELVEITSSEVQASPGNAEVAPRAATAPPGILVELLAGPAVGDAVRLGPGRHVVGRSPSCAVRVDDPAVEPHHLLLEVDPSGTASAVQLAGRRPSLVDGEPARASTVTLPGTVVDLGATLLRVAGHHGRDGGRRDAADAAAIVRPPRAAPAALRASVDVPASVVLADAPADGSSALGAGGGTGPGAPAGPMAASLIGVVAALVLAVVVGQPMFALFALTGAAASMGTWLVALARRRRQRRRAVATAVEESAAFGERLGELAIDLRERYLGDAPSLHRALSERHTASLWACRPAHGDAFTVAFGLGEVMVPVDAVTSDGREPGPAVAGAVARAGRLVGVPVTVALDQREQLVVALTGPLAPEVVRSMLVQLAVRTGPADWRAVAVSTGSARHEWIGRLPHAVRHASGRPVLDAEDPAALAAGLLALDDGDPRRLVLVTDAPALLSTRTSPLRRLLDAGVAITVLVEMVDEATPPAVCAAALETGQRATARWHPCVGSVARAAAATHHPSTGRIETQRVRIAGLSQVVAEQVAIELAELVDPEDPAAVADRLPSILTLDDLDSVPGDVGTIVAAWERGGRNAAPSAVIGLTADGTVELDLVRDGPHALVAGTTGSGKSELLRTLVIALAANVSPDHLCFVLVDYKGGAAFDTCASLPHVVGMVTDLDDGLAARALVSLDAELHRRERLLREVGASDLDGYRARADIPLPRLVVVIDELAALVKELPGFVAALVGVAQRGRSLGVHLVLATQRPAGVIDDAIRANTDLRIALRLNDPADAIDVVGMAEPATFPRGVPGRSLLRLGQSDGVVFQAAASSPRTVDAIRAAAAQTAVATPHRPWLPSLDELDLDAPDALDGIDEPDGIDRGGLVASVGVVDDPAGQRRFPLVWDRAGNLALVGALGSGTTTALVAIASAAIAADEQVHVYCIDSRGDRVLDVVAGSARCAGVVGVHDRERLERLITRLVAEIDERRAARPGLSTDDRRRADRVLLVDGLVATRRALDDPAFGASGSASARFDRILAEGPAVGIVVAAVVEPGGGSAVALLPRFAERWLFHLDDPGDGPTYGVRPASVPPAIPGRVVIGTSGLAAQIVPRSPQESSPVGASGGSVEPIGVLAETVTSDELGVPIDTGATLILPLGRDFDTLGPVGIEVPAGDHVLVVGPSRSGRTTALAQVTRAWTALRPDGEVVRIGPSGAAAADLPPVDGVTGPTLVVVDDAERVTDPSGRLTALVESAHPDVLVVAAGRADALRSTFGHWTGAVRRSRTGLVMASSSELDGDLLGASLPRRCPIATRPGLAWMVDLGGVRLVQLATSSPPSRDAV